MDEWTADIDVDVLPDGTFAPVLVLVPPVDVGPPIRRRLEGAYEHEEVARMVVLDAMVAMMQRTQNQGDPS